MTHDGTGLASGRSTAHWCSRRMAKYSSSSVGACGSTRVRRAPARDERVDEIGHVGLVLELDGGDAVAVVGAHERQACAASSTARVVGVEHDPRRGPVLVRELARASPRPSPGRGP